MALINTNTQRIKPLKTANSVINPENKLKNKTLPTKKENTNTNFPIPKISLSFMIYPVVKVNTVISGRTINLT